MLAYFVVAFKIYIGELTLHVRAIDQYTCTMVDKDSFLKYFEHDSIKFCNSALIVGYENLIFINTRWLEKVTIDDKPQSSNLCW